MKNRVRLEILIILMLGTLFVLATNASATAFPDVHKIHWAEEAISYWTNAGGISGYEDGYFYPNREITRAETAKIISVALNLQGDESDIQTFSDVPKEHWAYSYVELCTANGIFQGYEEDIFAPKEQLTRQEAATVLYRAMETPAENPRDALLNMADGYKVPAWAVSAMGTMLEKGILKGYPDGSVQPSNKITRAEFVSLLYRVKTYNEPENADKTEIIKSIIWSQNGAYATIQAHSGENWLFLPAGADLTKMNMEIKFQDSPQVNCVWSGDLGETANMEFDLTTLSSIASDGTYTLTVRASAEQHTEEKKINILQSSNVSAVFLTSKDEENRGISYVDAVKGNSVKGEMTYLNADGSIAYQGKLSQIKSRGNSTFVFYPKKSYQIKLDEKTDLLGIGEKVKTWVLLASFGDPTQMRDKLCKDLAADLQMDGAPDCNWVDLYFDGVCLGTYLISEKVAVGETGLDITDLEKAYEEVNENYGDDVEVAADSNRYGNAFCYVSNLTDPEDISDGYVIELNYQEGDENCWFKTSRNYAFNVKIPENLSKNAMAYISEFYQEFEDAVYSENGINPETGKSFDEYCDLDSLVKMYLIYTFSNNQDAYVQSTFFYLSGDKLYAGPIWDSDQTFGIGWSEEVADDASLKWDYLTLGLEQIPAFQDAVAKYYADAFRPVAMKYIGERIKEYSNILEGTEQINHVVWPIYYRLAGLEKAYGTNTTHSKIVELMQEWMQKRIEYMDARFNLMLSQSN